MNTNIPKVAAIRLECLRLALGRGASPGEKAIEFAREYEQYVNEGQAEAKAKAPSDRGESPAEKTPARKASSAPGSGKASASKPKRQPAAAKK